MSGSNGNGNGNGNAVVRIGRRGIVTFQLDDDYPKIPIDVVAVWNEWGRIDRSFRDDAGTVPDDKIEEHQASAVRFARDHMQQPDINAAEAWAIIARLTEEVDKLKDFLSVNIRERPSSPESSTILTTSD
jgi:hypothetical protein